MKKRLRLMAGLTAAAVLATGAGVAATDVLAGGPPPAAAAAGSGWDGITREQVRIDFGKGWVTGAELTYPSGAAGRLPVVVFLHGSGRNDMNQTLPDGKGSTFVPLAQRLSHGGFATLRFHKRGVTGVGPVESTDPAQLLPKRPYEQIQLDAASAIRFAATAPKVDASRVFLLGHSEGTNVAANLAADPERFGIPRPAGVIQMGVVGKPIRDLLTFQIHGRLLLQMHDEFDVDGNGRLTATEAADGLVGQPEEVVTQLRDILLDGAKVAPATDRNRDGQIAIDTEAGAVLRDITGIGKYPNVPGLDEYTVAYAKDFARFPTVTEALPRFAGPTLMLNGENDLQTPARVALVADAAVAAAGNRDHRIVIYPGMGHTMNITPRFTPEFGEPDRQVIDEISTWLAERR